MIPKRVVLSFIDKVQEKAMKAIADKYEPLIQAEREKAISDNPVLKDAAEVGQDCIDTLFEISQRLEKLNINFVTKHYGSIFSVATRFNKGNELVPVNFKGILAAECDLEILNSRIGKLSAEYYAKQNETREEYSKLYNYVRTMDGVKGTKYLESIGFDVSWIKENASKPTEDKIDKSKIFVCGDNK
jgi:hypothetical protein